jgi:hypothetical protein
MLKKIKSTAWLGVPVEASPILMMIIKLSKALKLQIYQKIRQSNH